MHGRGKMAAAPASEVAQRGDARGTPLPARRTVSNFLFFYLFFFVSGFALTRANLAPMRAKPGQFALNQIVSAEYRCVSAGKRKSTGEKKNKNLKSKIPVDLVRCCHRLHWP